MADKPILFSAPMVQALLAGRKTQTRRILNPQPTSHVWRHGWSSLDGATWSDETTTGKIRIWAGDRLYVREAWRAEARLDRKAPRDIKTNYPGIKYIATDEPDDFGIEGKYRQAMHMPRWASRLTLIVTDVCVERLHDCNEDDAKAEGIYPINLTSGLCAWKDYGQDGRQDAWASPIESYRTLWDSINGAGAWDKNPWIVAYTFTVLKQNIDEVA